MIRAALFPVLVPDSSPGLRKAFTVSQLSPLGDYPSQKFNLNSQDREFWWVVVTLGNSVVRRDARKKNRKLPIKICFKKKAAHLLKESALPKLIQFFSRDRRRRDVFYTSLCACRCLRASDRGRAPGHDPSDGRARSVRADRASSHRSSGSLHSMG